MRQGLEDSIRFYYSLNLLRLLSSRRFVSLPRLSLNRVQVLVALRLVLLFVALRPVIPPHDILSVFRSHHQVLAFVSILVTIASCFVQQPLPQVFVAPYPSSFPKSLKFSPFKSSLFRNCYPRFAHFSFPVSDSVLSPFIDIGQSLYLLFIPPTSHFRSRTFGIQFRRSSPPSSPRRKLVFTSPLECITTTAKASTYRKSDRQQCRTLIQDPRYTSLAMQKSSTSFSRISNAKHTTVH